MIADPSDSKLFHMFLSRMAGHCGLNEWGSNSEVIHATSTDPAGPWTYNQSVVPHFSHGPKIRRLANGSYLLMHLGCGEGGVLHRNCTNGTSTRAIISTSTSTANLPACHQFNVSYSLADSLYGPWTPGRQLFLSSNGTDPPWFQTRGKTFTNPAPWPLKNGSILCAFRANGAGRFHGESVSVALADTVDAPYVDARTQPAVWPSFSEDPVGRLVTVQMHMQCRPTRASAHTHPSENITCMPSENTPTSTSGKTSEATGICSCTERRHTPLTTPSITM